VTTRLVLDSIELQGGGRLVVEAESRPGLAGRLALYPFNVQPERYLRANSSLASEQSLTRPATPS